MGPKQSQPTRQQKDQVLKINHTRFQNVNFTKKDDDLCIEVKLPVANIKQYNQWVNDLKDAPVQSQNFLLPLSHEFQKQGFCGSSGYVKVLFQNFPYVLADEIRNRSSLKRKYFDEPQLWYLIYTLLSAGYQFHKTGKKIGDVRPQNVFINQDGQVKVATRLTWPSQNQNYHKTFYQKQPTYLAPQQLKDIHFAKMQPSCDPKLAQSFSIGLTCLDAGTLSSSSQFYNRSNKFEYNELSSKLQQLEKNAGYSQILCMTVSNLCEPDPDRRSSCTQLYKWLEPHEQNIINLERFEVANLPDKIARFGLSQQPQEPPRQISQNFNNQHTSQYGNGNIPSQQVTYIRQSQGQEFSNVNQANPISYQGQTVTYVNNSQTQSPIGIQGQNQYQIQNQLPNIQTQNIGYQQQLNQVADGQLNQNRTITTTTNYNYSQFPTTSTTSQYVAANQYVPQTVTYVRPPPIYQNSDGDRQKSQMEFNLQKIDEQLQMSRKMFPG